MTDHTSTGTEAAEPAMDEQIVENAAPVSRRRTMPRPAKAIAILGIAALVGGGVAYRGLSQAQPQAPMLTAIVPQNAE